MTLDPHHGPCWTAYGGILERQGDIDSARLIFTQGLKQVPWHGPLYRNLAEMECREKNYDRARSLYETGLEKDPFHADLFHSYAEMEAKLLNVPALLKVGTDPVCAHLLPPFFLLSP